MLGILTEIFLLQMNSSTRNVPGMNENCCKAMVYSAVWVAETPECASVRCVFFHCILVHVNITLFSIKICQFES